MSAEPITTDEHGFVTLVDASGVRVGRAPLHDRVPASVPDGRNRAERRKAVRLRRIARKDRSRAAQLRYELEVMEIRAICEQLAAEGKIERVGFDLYRGIPRPLSLADRLAERRERALGSVVVRKGAGEGEQS